MHMKAEEEIARAIKLQRKSPNFLSLKWTKIIGAVLEEGSLTSNEISRILDLGYKQRKSLRASLGNLRCTGMVRKRGNRFELTGEKVRYWKQRGLWEFK